MTKVRASDIATPVPTNGAAPASSPDSAPNALRHLGKSVAKMWRARLSWGDGYEKQEAGTAALALAKTIVRSGGSGDAADVAAVVAVLASYPLPLLHAIKAKGIKVIACKGTVTDACPKYKGVAARGWGGRTWDQIPAMYDYPQTAVVIGVDSVDWKARLWSGDFRIWGMAAAGVRGEPKELFGNYQLTCSQLLHELGHAFDYHGFGLGSALRRFMAQVDGNLGVESQRRDFQQAYAADRPKLMAGKDYYLLQPDAAGLEEAYAETFARFVAGDPSLASTFPHLYAYWQRKWEAVAPGGNSAR